MSGDALFSIIFGAVWLGVGVLFAYPSYLMLRASYSYQGLGKEFATECAKSLVFLNILCGPFLLIISPYYYISSRWGSRKDMRL